MMSFGIWRRSAQRGSGSEIVQASHSVDFFVLKPFVGSD
jgi:hypothetical protein